MKMLCFKVLNELFVSDLCKNNTFFSNLFDITVKKNVKFFKWLQHY